MTHDDQSKRRFEKAPDSSWIRKVEKTHSQGQRQGHVHPRNEKVEIQQMEGGVDPQGALDPQSDQSSEPELDIFRLSR